MAGIYLHIPFCKQACHYCDFHFSTNLEVRTELIQAMLREIELQRHYLEGEPVRTIYFGGGTPSLLRAEEIRLLLESIHKFFQVDGDAEVTLESNPDDLTLPILQAFKKAGINRLSIGIQSFEDTVLKFLNRAHDTKAAVECIEQARTAGFNNISMDLIYAIPGQDMDGWKKNLEKAIELNPEHLSAYSLTIEEKTAFGRWASHGKLKPVEDDSSAGQMDVLIDTLTGAGYEHYEISNFSKPGHYSKHNSSYWKQQKYLGVGPSAHSYNLVSRQFNVRNNHQYIRSLKEGKIPFDLEVLSTHDHVNEYLLTTLRTQWGTDLQFLKQEYGYDVPMMHANFISRLEDNGLAVMDQMYLKLTRKGRLLADKISSDLFLVS